jgi:ABC-2 type transport system ATP-binding protein
VPVVAVEGLRKHYGRTEAVRDVGFEVEAGEVFALLGPNGAGKTTTLEILEGFRTRDAGRAEVLGFDPDDRATSRKLRQRLGIVLQELAIEPYLSVAEVLARTARFYPNPRPVEEVIDLVGLHEKAHARVKTLSGGQQRRLDVGLGIIGRPDLVLLDEPTTGFDPSARRGAWALIRELRGGGTTVLLTTHYMEEAEALADRVAIISDGRIVACGTPASIGGRGAGAAHVRFALPDGVSAGELPVAASVDGSRISIETSDDIATLHRLTGWALDRGVELAGLTVERTTLEDVYLRLTQRDDGP